MALSSSSHVFLQQIHAHTPTLARIRACLGLRAISYSIITDSWNTVILLKKKTKHVGRSKTSIPKRCVTLRDEGMERGEKKYTHVFL